MPNNKTIVHVVGTGTIGEPLIGLFNQFRDAWAIDEVTFHKRTPSAMDRAKVNQLMDHGARLATDEEARDDFAKLGHRVSYDAEEAIERATVVVDCTPAGNDNKAKYYDRCKEPRGFLALSADTLSGDPINVLDLSIGSIVVTLLVGARLVLLQRERNRMLSAVDVGREKYRELFEQADESRAALVVQNERLRELDHLKDNLISVVSHELRTPLTSILGYLELLDQDRDRLTQRHRHFLGVVGRNAERLLDVVVDLLFVAQARAGHMTLDREPLDLAELAQQAVEGTLPAANERQITISVAPCADSVVSGDRQRLGQVLDNLLSNALKFTPRNGSVEVRLSASRDNVVLEVADTGIGISAGAQRELFTRFFRTDAAIEAAIQGTGLGLSIVKAIVDGHGGQVSVESVEGEGATFTVKLPRLAAARAA